MADSNTTRYELVTEYVSRCRAGKTTSVEDFLDDYGVRDVDGEMRGLLEQARSWPTGEVEQRLTLWASSTGTDLTITMPRESAGGEPGAMFDGRYRIVRTLGQGGCGVVHLVQDTLSGGEELALKVVHSEFVDDADFEQRFRNEIRILRALNNPGIPQIFNDGKSPQGDLYYTMSFVRGRPMDELLTKEAPLPPERVQRIVAQLAEVLDYAHSHGIVHRDLKPSNVILSPGKDGEERVLVLDFGIAKILERAGLLERALTMQTQNIIGTPHYMSPEQVRGQDIDETTDIYALGCIAYQMCSGNLPFTGKTMMEVLTARLDNDPPKLTPGVTPDWMAKTIKRMLAQDKAKRPSCPQIQKEFTNPKTSSIKRVTGVTGGSSRLPLALVGIAVVAAGGFGAWKMLGAGAAQPTSAEPETELAQIDPPQNGGEVDPGRGPSDDGGEDGSKSERLDDTEAPAESEPAKLVEQAETTLIVPRLLGVDLVDSAPIYTNSRTHDFRGSVTPAAAIPFEVAFIGGNLSPSWRAVQPDSDGNFEIDLALPDADGEYTLQARVENLYSPRVLVQVNLDRSPPTFNSATVVESEPVDADSARVRVTFGETQALEIRNPSTGRTYTIFGGSGQLDIELPARPSIGAQTETIQLEATDSAGNVTQFGVEIRIGRIEPETTARKTPSETPTPKRALVVDVDRRYQIYRVGDREFRVIEAGGKETTWALPRAVETIVQTSTAAPPTFEVTTRTSAGSDTSSMVLVPERFVSSGNEDTILAPFLMDQYEVSWKRYERFVNSETAAGHSVPSYFDLSDRGYRPNDHVLGIPWTDAKQFTDWAGRTLPNTPEWEAAAGWTGQAKQTYPFGDEIVPRNLVTREFSPNLIDRDELRGDTSPWGVIAMATGVKEWCGDTFAGDRATRGWTSYQRRKDNFELAYENPSYQKRCQAKFRIEAGDLIAINDANSSSLKIQLIGFRCIIRLEKQ